MKLQSFKQKLANIQDDKNGKCNITPLYKSK